MNEFANLPLLDEYREMRIEVAKWTLKEACFIRIFLRRCRRA